MQTLKTNDWKYKQINNVFLKPWASEQILFQPLRGGRMWTETCRIGRRIVVSFLYSYMFEGGLFEL